MSQEKYIAEIQKEAEELFPHKRNIPTTPLWTAKNFDNKNKREAFIAGANSKAVDQRMIDFVEMITDQYTPHPTEKGLYHLNNDFGQEYKTTAELLLIFKAGA